MAAEVNLRGQRQLILDATIVAGLAAAWFSWSARADDARRLVGDSLFHGRAAVTAHLVGHAQPLPEIASRCSNCHEAADQAPRVPGAPSTSPSVFAGTLGIDRLKVARQRRGGPASVYDSTAFCRVLCSGVDPTNVMISVEMPRYQLTDDQCRSLWFYLIEH